MSKLKVIDLSYNNTIPEDLTAARAQGVIGMVHSITEGSEGDDSKAEARIYLAEQAGMLVGGYHTIDDESTANAQVKNFTSVLEALDQTEDWLLAVRVEDTEVPVSKVLDFLTLAGNDTEKQLVLMATGAFIQKASESELKDLEEFPLWLIQHDSVADIPLAWSKYFLWQFAEGEDAVEGVKGEVGQSSFWGSDELLAKAWTGDAEATLPEVPPTKPEANGDDAQIQEPEMTPEGELDKPADSGKGELEDGSGDANTGGDDEASAGTLPSTPPTTPDQELPEAPDTPDQSLPSGGGGSIDNALPEDQPEIDNDVREGVDAPDNSLPETADPKKK